MPPDSCTLSTAQGPEAQQQGMGLGSKDDLQITTDIFKLDSEKSKDHL